MLYRSINNMKNENITDLCCGLSGGANRLLGSPIEENLVYLIIGALVFPKDLLAPRGFKQAYSAVASNAAFSCLSSSASTTAAANLGSVRTFETKKLFEKLTSYI